jgi:glycosyltransferase involved in cell wall biosynthesis
MFDRDEVGVLAGESVEEYGSALTSLLADRERCARLGLRAREVAESRYSWSYRAPELEKVYRSAVREKMSRQGAR